MTYTGEESKLRHLLNFVYKGSLHKEKASETEVLCPRVTRHGIYYSNEKTFARFKSFYKLQRRTHSLKS